VTLAIASIVHWDNASTGLAVLFVARVIDGISGGNLSVAQAFVSDVTGPKERTGGMAMLGAAFGIGFAAGPAIGGLLGEISPALPAIAGAACALTAAILTWTRLPDTRRRPAEPHLPPPIVDEFAEPTQEAPRTLFTLSRDKLMPIVRNRLLLQLILIWSLAMFAFVILESIFAVFAEARFDFGPAQVGGFFALAGVTIVLVQGLLVGRLSRRFGDWPLVVAGPTLVAAAMCLLIVASQLGILSLVYLSGILNSAGRSLLNSTLSALVSRTADPDRQGVTFGVYHGVGSLARVAGPLAAGALFEVGITLPFGLAAVLAASAAVWLLMLALRRAAPRPAPLPT
jgi:MFS family permease